MWAFVIHWSARRNEPAQVEWSGHIVVPFAPETPASTIGETGFFSACWYRRSFTATHVDVGVRLLLHFGAVDYAATVWCNGHLAGGHEGGYSPFTVDLTPFLDAAARPVIVVRGEDDPLDLAKPR